MRQPISGFTSVEVLITLFVAAILVLGGYQTYGIVSNSLRETRERSSASNYAYDALRRHADTVTNSCSARTQTITSQLPSNHGLTGSPVMTVTFTCPHGTGINLSQVQVRLTYASPIKEVVHGLYVTSQ